MGVVPTYSGKYQSTHLTFKPDWCNWIDTIVLETIQLRVRVPNQVQYAGVVERFTQLSQK